VDSTLAFPDELGMMNGVPFPQVERLGSLADRQIRQSSGANQSTDMARLARGERERMFFE
jgi:hypothetical protein